MFINLGLSLGTSALFYGVCFLSQYLGGDEVDLARTLRLGAPDRLRQPGRRPLGHDPDLSGGIIQQVDGGDVGFRPFDSLTAADCRVTLSPTFSGCGAGRARSYLQGG